MTTFAHEEIPTTIQEQKPTEGPTEAEFDPEYKHPFQYKWVVWEHRNDCENYADNIQPVCEFDTVEVFWTYWHHLPQPVDFFFAPRQSRKTISNRSVVSYSIFREKIKPEWEDPVACKGGEWRIRRFKNLDDVNHIWEEITLLVLGCSLKCNENIIGVRVVDSSHPTTNKAMYNVEIWFDDMDCAEDIKNSIGENIPELDISKMYLRSHSG
tara:strand:- start:140 stop:772 length:633 start_codon:yes stop_codon:yes gene_type:complete